MVHRCSIDAWRIFKKYHYLSEDISKCAQCYGLFDGDNIVGFCGVTHFPHPKNSKLKRGHRLVLLPDYQGIGLGMKFFNIIADIYNEQGYDFTVTNSSIALINGLKKDKRWIMTRYGKNVPSGHSYMKGLYKSSERITASFIRPRNTVVD